MAETDVFNFEKYASAHIQKASEEFSQVASSGEYKAYLDADFSQLAEIVQAIKKNGYDTILKPSVIYLDYEWGTLKIYPNS